jgi:hypothetical protein
MYSDSSKAAVLWKESGCVHIEIYFVFFFEKSFIKLRFIIGNVRLFILKDWRLL